MLIASAEEDVQDAEWSAPEAVLRYLRLIRVARAERDKARDRARDLDHVATLAKERGNRAEATAARYREALKGLDRDAENEIRTRAYEADIGLQPTLGGSYARGVTHALQGVRRTVARATSTTGETKPWPTS